MFKYDALMILVLEEIIDVSGTGELRSVPPYPPRSAPLIPLSTRRKPG